MKMIRYFRLSNYKNKTFAVPRESYSSLIFVVKALVLYYYYDVIPMK